MTRWALGVPRLLQAGEPSGCSGVCWVGRPGRCESKAQEQNHLVPNSQCHLQCQSLCPLCATGALKSYLRELPEPLMTFELYEEWIQASK